MYLDPSFQPTFLATRYQGLLERLERAEKKLKPKEKSVEKLVVKAVVKTEIPTTEETKPPAAATPIPEQVVVEKKKHELKHSDLKPATESPSFNISKVDAATWKKMHIAQKSKYIAYSLPDQPVQDQMRKSQIRASAIMKEQREKSEEKQKQMQIILQRKRDKYNNEQEIQAAKEGIMRSRKRREAKLLAEKKLRDAEIQILIEGQKSSFDAIRLKEFLSTFSVKSEKDQLVLTHKDKLRLDKLFRDS